MEGELEWFAMASPIRPRDISSTRQNVYTLFVLLGLLHQTCSESGGAAKFVSEAIAERDGRDRGGWDRREMHRTLTLFAELYASARYNIRAVCLVREAIGRLWLVCNGTQSSASIRPLALVMFSRTSKVHSSPCSSSSACTGGCSESGGAAKFVSDGRERWQRQRRLGIIVERCIAR